jgi:hypothetical protein
MSPRLRSLALVRAVEAVRSTDPAQVESALAQLSGGRRWLRPLAYAAGTVAIVFDGVVLLLRHWQLSLLQIVPACWIWVMTWNLKNHFLSNRHIPPGIGPVAVIGVLIAAQVAYWRNATFAYTMIQGDATSTRAAFREARPHWRLVGGLAPLTSALQATIWLLMPYMRVRWFWIALLVMFVVQVYLFIAIPSWLLAVEKSGSRRDHMTRSLTTGVLSGVASTPGFLFNRIGLLLLGVGGAVFWVGVAVVSIGAVLHVTASSSVRVVKMSLRLRPAAAPTPPIAAPKR